MTETGGDTPPEQGPEEEEDMVDQLIKKYMNAVGPDMEATEDEIKGAVKTIDNQLAKLELIDNPLDTFIDGLLSKLNSNLYSAIHDTSKEVAIDYEKNKLYVQTSSDVNEYVFNLNYPALGNTFIGCNINPWSTGNVIGAVGLWSDTLNKIFPWNGSDEISFHAVSNKNIPCPWYGCDFVVEIELIVDNEDSYALNE